MFREACVVALVAGCVGGEVAEPTLGELAQNSGGGNCDEFMCGTNSPQIAEFGFWELNLPTSLGAAGKPNNVGLQVLAFEKGPYTYVPTVYGGRLTASRRSAMPPYATITIAGGDLVGGWFALANGDRRFRLRIAEVGSVASWAQPKGGASPVMLESYLLDWSELAGNTWSEPRNLGKALTGGATGDALGMTGPYALHTLLFEGDRIDATRKLDTGVDPTWINFGVAGTALAKLALTGHTEASLNAGAFETTLAERQAMLKLLVADYCGDGTPFTVAGQPLNWRDDRGTMSLTALAAQPPLPLVLEARWTEAGAACLDQPRVDAHWTQLGADTFGPDIYEQIRSHCGAAMPPPCTDHGFEVDGYHLLTASVPLAAPSP